MDCILIATSVFSRYLAQLICQNVDEIDSAVVLFVVWLSLQTQTYFRSLLPSTQKEKRRPEIRLCPQARDCLALIQVELLIPSTLFVVATQVTRRPLPTDTIRSVAIATNFRVSEVIPAMNMSG